MDIRILGPLEVLEDGLALDLGGAKQRAVLAMLALHANRVVPQEQLIEALWDDEPPDSAKKALQVYVSQLRKLLGRDRVETKGGGYLLRLEPDELDLARFERLQDAGRAEEALSLWRGEPLADFAEHRFAQAEIARLEELRLSSLERRIESDLADGRHAELVGELDALAREHPLRENLRAQLMLAYYRAGRQAEALEAYQTARGALVDELGIEPGRTLRELHQQILRQDPALDLPTRKLPERAAPAAAPRAPIAATRKTVTVLFCDLVRSTELGEELDPESLRTLLARWYEAMREPLERHGGTVEKFIGDAVMAVFGVPRVHEDDALRAVRAAVEMRSAVAALNAELRTELAIRVGINSGEVVTGDHATTLVTGDAVNTAKRLEEAAPPGEILIGAATHRLVENAAELEPAEPVEAKGKRTSVETWRVLGTIAGATPFARRLDAPLVGRARELAFLREELAAAERERTCRLVTLVGAAGIGKSRLAGELLAEVEERAGVLSARCLPYGHGITFLPLAELVRSAGGEQAMIAAVEAEPDGALIVERVCGALGTGAGSAPASSEETFWAIRRLLETLARERPLVVCLEDVHWAQPMFLDLLEYLAGWSRDAPVVLLCLARPELLDERPRWGGTSLAVEALTEAESQKLLDELGSEWPLTPEARAQIADGAEGNPLFLEQMVAMLSDSGTLPSELPPTIQALLAARLDRLEPLERSVLERAAVVGKEFWRGAVVDLSPRAERRGVVATLFTLVRKELVRPELSRFVGDDGFRFRHALIRDAAYSAIPKSLRAELHEQFADWLAARAGEDELVGYHLEQAARYRAELGVADEALAARAGALLARAGEQAYARDDVPAAANLLERASLLLNDGDSTRIEVLILLGSTFMNAGELPRVRPVLEEARDLARALGDRGLETRAGIELEFLATLTTSTAATDEIVAVAERAIHVLQELGDDGGLSRAWRLQSEAHVLACRWADRAAALERALHHARRAGDRRQQASLVALLAQALHYGPTPAEDAIARCERLLAETEAGGALAAALMSTLGGLYAMRGDFDRARSLWTGSRTLYEELGLQHRRAARSLIAASIELLADDPAAAERELRLGYGTLALMGETYVRATLAAYLAAVLVELGRDTEALNLSRESETNARADDVVTQVVWRGARARVLAYAGEQAEAVALARDAIARAAGTDFLDLRAGAFLDLAAVLAATDPVEAADAAARAVREYERKGNVVGARRAQSPAPSVAR